MLRPRTSRPTLLGLAGLALAGVLVAARPAAADRVVLLNGQVFEDVATELRGSSVAIRIGGGALVLPSDQVARVEPGPSTLEEYGRRAAALRAGGAAPGEWLELARWSRARSFDFGAREAGLAAAEGDPTLAGLDPLLRALGYERDETSGRWLPFAEAMRRRGWVEEGGEWVPAAVAEARQRARAEASAERRRAAEAARVERLTALAELQLTRQLAEPEPPAWGYPYWPIWGVPIVVPAPVPGPQPAPETPPRAPGRKPAGHTHNGILDRQPGSLIPIAPPT